MLLEDIQPAPIKYTIRVIIPYDPESGSKRRMINQEIWLGQLWKDRKGKVWEIEKIPPSIKKSVRHRDGTPPDVPFLTMRDPDNHAIRNRWNAYGVVMHWTPVV